MLVNKTHLLLPWRIAVSAASADSGLTARQGVLTITQQQPHEPSQTDVICNLPRVVQGMRKLQRFRCLTALPQNSANVLSATVLLHVSGEVMSDSLQDRYRAESMPCPSAAWQHVAMQRKRQLLQRIPVVSLVQRARP